MERKKINRIISLCLLGVFCWQLAGLSLFVHSHTVDGMVVTHSHPFSGTRDNPGHNHSTSQLDAIAHLSLLIFILGVITGLAGPQSRTVSAMSVFKLAPVSQGEYGEYRLRGPPRN